MASGLYDLGRGHFLDGNIDWSANTIKCFLIDSGAYTVNLATDEHAANTPTGDIPAAAKIATSAALTAKTSTNGVADAADVTFSSVTGATVEAIVVYVDGATPGTDDYLIAYIDNAPEFPVTPNGGDITVTWDSGANKIFKL
ncbi:MAG: hypothetical protein ACE5E0_03445 [Terriglobia bacterium]